MTRRKFVFGVVGVVIIGAAAVLYSTIRPSGPAFIDPADQSLVMQGKAIYVNNCAACHGEALQGQPNWRERMSNGRLPAPPHDKSGHTWHHPDAMLVDMVKNGLVPGKTAPPGYVSDMPAYRDILSDQEIIAVLTYIKSTWPPKVLEAQKEVTLQRQN
ncbi:c-type cytochrome [Eoetvoesiella caeni]|uniref:Cbb3-type cytochrome c oxidase subunit III n=1 Tax=Eoetvoesiella caeni TaxID=645616 RepID=A0A366HE90_9BURK|nr:cytochrome c [Eoetvoesiella caeni]MCI2808861.1 cytochrome c [Eoetvoesiella caeni]NYT55638.1 cytochrome c [Eoetvoesiella caeni]RBP40196.1 cbb3-type cytochrome c oxidase subunit III [Eoetvoesiella caeni]